MHRAHRNERDDIKSQLESCESSIIKCKNSQGSLEDQYRFFQEMRGYVRDLVECLNEKVGVHVIFGFISWVGRGDAKLSLGRGHAVCLCLSNRGHAVYISW